MLANAIIIGAGRSGSTALFEYLAKQPNVCTAELKELHYFSFEDLYNRGEDYLSTFYSHYNDEPVKLMADTYLMVHYKAIERIKAYNPNIKIISILRNPIDRAYSSYHYALNNDYQPVNTTFEQAIHIDKNTINSEDIIEVNNKCHFYQGLYYKHLSYWQQHFPKENFLTLTTNELKQSQQATVEKVCAFLDVQYQPVSEEYTKRNKAKKAKSKGLQQLLLNRNHPLRKFARWATPKWFRNSVLKSGAIQKVDSINRTDTEYRPITEAERLLALSYFEEDLKNLKNDFGISFDD